jgi:hypothetical protein
MMALRTATTPTASRKPGTKGIIAGACGAALALAVAVGIGARLTDEREGTGVGTPAQSGVALPADAEATKPWYLRYGEGTTWYLVASIQQAEEAGDVLSYRNKTMLLQGKPLPDERVVVVESPLAERETRFAISEEYERRLANGLPPLTIVDLRSSPGR